ncbi:MAG: HNH endonuclease signature motif containing protein, partial [Gammaproteobacteria bacterium]
SEHRDKVLKSCKKYASKDPSAYREKQSEKYQKHGHKYRERLREQYAKDPTAVLTRNAGWRERNSDKVAADKIEWARLDRAKYPAKWRAIYAARHSTRIQRTPVWADMEAINFFYECCPEGCEVDHIIPLQGKNIFGFHIETNLQWLTMHDNRIKNNKYAS